MAEDIRVSAAGFGLGRLPAPDDRDKAFPMRALAPQEPPARDYRYFLAGPVLNQGNSSSCVGMAWRGFLSAAPLMTRGGPDARAIYRAAQDADEWPGAEPAYYGTSVRAGAKVLQDGGHIASYHWANSAEEVARFILSDTGGCVIAGTVWTADMFRPDALGFVTPTGATVGGHAWLITGYSRLRGLFRARNSWGRFWGRRGNFWLTGEHLAELLRRDGEACAAVERRVAT